MSQYEEDDIIERSYDRQLILKLLYCLKPHSGWIIISVILLLIASILQLLGPLLTRQAVDQYISQKNYQGVDRLALLYLGILISVMLLQYAQSYIVSYIGQKIMYDLRLRIFNHLQELSLRFFDTNPIGRLMTRVTNDVQNLNETLTVGIVTAFGDLMLLIGIIGIMLSFHWQLALVTFSVLPLLIYAAFLFRNKVRKSYALIRKRLARINSFLQESISGISVIQVFNREDKNLAHFDGLNKDYLQAFLKTIFYYGLFYPGVEIISSLAIALILWYGGVSILHGTLTFGTLVAFFQYVNRFFQPIQDLSEKYNILQDAMASSERIFSLLETEPDIKNKLSPIGVDGIKGGIEFRNVWFAYDNENFVLKDLSFSVKPGESIAFVGATGAGKSSIINLLSRFYDIQKGQILIDGIDIRSIEKHQLRKHIGVVLQDVFLFSGTIGDNIRLGNMSITDEKMIEAAVHVNAHDFIQQLSEGYNSEVAERGANLSVGQKQLLAFARALAFNPEILVLDEATSSIDTETELLIQDAVRKLMKGRTSIIIAHRLSTIQKVDRIIVLHKGEIKETGTHQELLRNRDIYYRLYQLQYKDQEVETQSYAV